MHGPSFASRPHRLRALLLAVGLALSVAGCATNPVEPTPSPVTATASTTREGVTVTVSASSATVAGGDTIRLHVSAVDTGLEPVTWQSGGCGLMMWFGVDGPEIVQPPPGTVLPGVANLIKWAASSDSVAYAGVRRPGLPADAAMACPADLGYDDFGPGETISTEADWPATTTDGVPLPPGPIRITYAFPFVAHGTKEGLLQGPIQNVAPIPVALPITIGGVPVDAIPSTDAMDAALTDPRVADWVVQRVPRERLNGARIQFVDGAWQLTVLVKGDRSTVVRVDPTTGHVVDVQLAD